MGKISRVSLARKRELEKPDRVLEFLQRASLWVGLHRRQVIMAAGIFMAVVVIITGGSFLSNRARKTAFDRLTQIMSGHDASVIDVDSADMAQQYRLLNEKHGRTVAGKIAGLKYADACYQSGDYEKAITAYQEALAGLKQHPLFKTLASNGLGYAYESSGAYDKALTCFRQITEDPRSMMKDKALFHLGRMYDLTGDAEKRKAAFDRIIAEYPDSFYAEIVREGGGA